VSRRQSILEKRKTPWDIIIIGGGITGAGILREALRCGLRCLLLDQKDFAWGTSSRSGKLVHGGLRYLKQGQVKTTWHSVREREKLLLECGGLVEPLGFLMPTYLGDRLGPLLLQAGLSVYDLIALRKSRRRFRPEDIALMAPALKGDKLSGGFWYRDARTDDARLVLNVIREAVNLGGFALNYVRVTNLCSVRGRVRGVAVEDMLTGQCGEIEARVVINATGVWADQVRSMVHSTPGLRRLRGSHLIFPGWRFPLALAVSIHHPGDGRPLYAFPWEGVTLLGTTDLDHEHSLEAEPWISLREGKYLMEAVQHYFPSLNLSGNDVVSTFSGVRPVVNTGKTDPSREAREHVIWADNGLITITGGKLTTFALLARAALAIARKYIGRPGVIPPKPGEKKASTNLPSISSEIAGNCEYRRLAGRYGTGALDLLKDCRAEDLTAVPGTETLWGEIPWAAREEVVHLDDLLLRRVRLGMLVPEGGVSILSRLRKLAQPVLGWDNTRWEMEETRYFDLWKQFYSPGLIYN